MSSRNFSNTASVGSVNAVLNNTDAASSVVVATALSGWPSTPCIATLGLSAGDEEVVLVTAISGTNVTFTRGYDGSPKRAHTAGTTLTHTQAAIDLREANDHVNATSGVHGVTGSVVGTSDTQTLSGKTLTAPVIADFTNAGHSHAGASTGGVIPLANITGLTAALAAKAVDTSVVHVTGVEAVAGAKSFSDVVNVAGLLTASAGAAVAKATGNTVPLAVNSSGAVQANVVMFYGTAAYSLVSAASAGLVVDLTGRGLASILTIQLTPIQTSNVRIDAQVNQITNTQLNIFVHQSENVATTAAGNIYFWGLATI